MTWLRGTQYYAMSAFTSISTTSAELSHRKPQRSTASSDETRPSRFGMPGSGTKSITGTHIPYANREHLIS